MYTREKGTVISYSLLEKAEINLSIYNSLGQRVKTLVNSTQDKRTYKILWNGRNDAGESLGGGVYFYSFKSPWQNEVGKLVVLR